MKIVTTERTITMSFPATGIACPQCGAITPIGFRGRFGLTSRESQVADLAMRGFANCEISGKLSISEQTVKRHLVNLFPKVRVDGRVELMIVGLLGREALKQLQEEKK